jgi:hypothetical protein
MNCVKSLSLLSRLMDQLKAANLKSRTQNAVDYFAMIAGAHRVGFDYSKC